MITTKVDETTIQEWLKQAIANELKTTPERIDSHQPFSSYRLDSVVTVTLAVDMEEWLGCPLDPSVFWEFETIADLASWLVNDYLPTRNQ